MNKKVMILILFCLFANVIFAQNKANGLKTEELKAHSNNLMKLLFNDKIEDAFAVLSKNWPVSGKELDGIKAQTLKQQDAIKQRFGNKIEYLLIEEKELSDFLIKHVYVIKYEYHITRWVIIYYKPKDKWIINSFKWDDQAESLF